MQPKEQPSSDPLAPKRAKQVEARACCDTGSQPRDVMYRSAQLWPTPVMVSMLDAVLSCTERVHSKHSQQDVLWAIFHAVCPVFINAV